MSEKSLKGKIIKLFIKESVNHKIPIFRVKLDSGEIGEYGRGQISVETFGKNYTLRTADQMAKHQKQTFYGLKVGDTIYISQQRDWD